MSELIATSSLKARKLTKEEIHDIDHELTLYPFKQAVGLEALKIVQKYQGWVSDESMLAIAQYLDVPVDELEGVATFFNLIYRKPVGRHVILFCDSVACWMLGCDDLKEFISSRLGIDYGETTEDGLFTLLPVPCLGNCDKAPSMMIGRELYENLDQQRITEILDSYANGQV